MFWNKGKSGLTDAEKLLCVTLRAFFASPIRISCRLENLTDFERDLLTNEEIIAVSQDTLAEYPDEIRRDDSLGLYRRALENGDTAYAVFNMTGEKRSETLILPEGMLRDLWAKEYLALTSSSASFPDQPLEQSGGVMIDIAPGRPYEFTFDIEPHGARLFRMIAPCCF